jgi:1,4-dihydroxy-2-naphthoate polyprenyltransferase
MPWLLALRPKTLPAAVVPVLVGVACSYAHGMVQWLPSLAALIGALLLQVGSNFANDVFDYEKGADTDARLGPVRAVASGLITPKQMKRATLLVFLLALLVGAYLCSVAGPLILLIGVASMLSAVAYTGGPYPLGYHGLGDVFVMIFFGFVAVCGTTYVNTSTVTPLSIGAAVPVGALATAVLVVNNVRDIETDRLAGKRTLAVRLGRAAGVWEYRLLLIVAVLMPAILLLLDHVGPLALLPLFSAPLAFRLQASVERDRGSQLNTTLANTAKLMLVFGVLFALGIVLGSAGALRPAKGAAASGQSIPSARWA